MDFVTRPRLPLPSLLPRLLLCALLLLPQTSVFAETAEAAEEPLLLVYGDSLSAAYNIPEAAGWVALLEEKLAAEGWAVQVANGSVSGETTTGGLARLPGMLDYFNPRLVILQLGGNDGLRGLPIHLMRANLAQMIEAIQQRDALVLLAGVRIPPNYGPRYTEPFFATFGELAQQYELPLLPFLIEGIPEQPALMQADGIHPTAAAQPQIVENIWPLLEPMLEQMTEASP